VENSVDENKKLVSVSASLVAVSPFRKLISRFSNPNFSVYFAVGWNVGTSEFIKSSGI